ncbi:MAG TPA: FliH/SctL family protein [Anaerolineaceae bacterium]
MKSSPSRVINPQDSQLSGWTPIELEVPQPEEPLPDSRQILALFQPNPQDPEPGLRTRREGGLVKVQNLAAWHPEKLVAYHPQTIEPNPNVEPEFTNFVDMIQTTEEIPLRQTGTAVFVSDEEAESIRAEARRQAEEIVQQAQQQASLIIQQAQQEGFQQGYQTGKETAAEELRAEMDSLLRTAHNIIVQFKGWRDEMLQNSESTVIGMVKEMAQAMFGEGIILSNEALEQTFSQVMENARTLGTLKIYINPEDAVGLGPYWRENQMAISGQQIQLIPSDAIQRGGCFVDGEFGSIDARVETQLKALINTIENAQNNKD